MCAWLKRNAESINAIGSIATVLAFIAGIYVINQTQVAFDENTQSLKAQKLLELQLAGLSVQERLHDIYYPKCPGIFADSYAAEDQECTKLQERYFSELTSYYNVVYSQTSYEFAKEELTERFFKTFCFIYINSSPYKAYWDTHSKSSSYTEGFLALPDNCRKAD